MLMMLSDFTHIELCCTPASTLLRLIINAQPFAKNVLIIFAKP
jgi:hypothetical protein